MKACIIYDSMYGNTQKVAQAIGEGLTGEVKLVRIGEANPSELKTCDLLIIGSPVHGGRATPALDTFIKQLPANSLEGISVAAFDTRFESEEQGVGLRLLMSVIRYAAPRLAKAMEKKGGILVAEPEGFIVENKEGPLKEGELERATKWASQLSLAKKVPAPTGMTN
ncbi:MAG: flavodoxin family protein [Ktedonobacteraceae bacterium]